jgi:peptidoglycan hydrolase-like protein with peptidoglycan-binding domain
MDNRKIIKITEEQLKKVVSRVIVERIESTKINTINEEEENINPKKLKIGDGGKSSKSKQADVITLQKKLIGAGLLKTKTGKPTGYFGPLTDAALKKYNETESTTISGGDGQGVKTIKKYAGKKYKNFHLDCVKNSPKKKITKLKSGSIVYIIDGYYFYENGRVKTPKNQMASYFCFKNGVKIKSSTVPEIYLETGVETKRTESSLFSGGLKGFLRKKFPNIAQILFTRPLTQDDFTESQKKVVYNVINNAIHKRGTDRNFGGVEYIDYSPKIDQQLNKNGGASFVEMALGSALSDDFRVATTLGRFAYELQPDGSYKVTDEYDFSKWKNFTVSSKELEGMEYTDKIAYIMSKTDLGVYGAIRHLGWLEHPDSAPKATKTKITMKIDTGYYASLDKKTEKNIGTDPFNSSTTALA